ncbi:carboxypeptidase [Capronia epimyces CBS 606.96]|uniref:Carboxypeptidase n=1 Tax=Capronia epimyces CBS 606.96 TaxID=1182542 RepID=W9YCL7_9EURO|nr:carboxypeptidase [Capronia epimyces CBS 606.96]EXJ80079.1 carboxypeptidase [Capronia epimyces CBS 606.96]
MLLTILLSACLVLCSLAVDNPHKRAPKRVHKTHASQIRRPLVKRQESSYLTPQTKKFAVNGSAIPLVDFDIGESYAGTLSIDHNSSNLNQLYFWFFPSNNPAASDEITIWLNGGPGCSSLDGLLQENGPFLWQSGTYKPQPNPFTWVNLTNMVYVDQPIGTGFSPAAPGAPAKIRNEVDIGRDFAGFWLNFMNTFNLTGRKVYITGESYAGQYIPYIASYMLDQNNTDYFNVKGIQINDPSIGSDAVLIQAPAVTALNNYQNIFALNQSFLHDINSRAERCGYFQFMEEALTFPPTGKFTAPNDTAPGCDVWDDIIAAAVYVNPCLNLYHLTDFCPFLSDELGFPSLGVGPNNYFNRSDVQAAINAPPTNYVVCGDDSLFPNGDESPPSSFTALPSVIERTNNVLVGSGLLDFLLLTNGTLMTLNNMTWNGRQGFSKAPSDLFYVPYDPSLNFVLAETENQPIPAVPVGLVAGGGIMGTTHTERGLTWVTVDLAGHEIPQYTPGAAYRQLEFLLGRISNLTEIGLFTTQQASNGSTASL